MKKFSKILSILLCLTLVLGLAAVVGAEEPASATISFDSTDNRTVLNNNQQVWVQNGITVTNDKESSTTNVADYSKPARFYAGSKLTIAYAGMTSIEVACNSTTYATELKNSISDSSVTVDLNQKVVTITFTTAVDSFVIASLSKQVRVDSITVYNGSTGGSGNEGGEETVPTTPEEIVNAAYALEQGKSLSGTYSLTGKIISVDTPYSEQYSNITVTIQVGDMTDKPIQCFRMKGEGAATLAVNDTITVTGTLKNYNGTVEFDSGCTVSDIVKGTADPGTGDEPTLTTPEEIVNAAYALEQGKSLSGTYSLTGKIISVDNPYSEQYSNITVTIQVGDMTDKPIQCFRLKGEGAATLAVGDTITVTGTLMNYNGTVEFNSGCTVSDIVKGEANPGEGEENPPKTSYTGTLLSGLKDGDEVVIYSDYLKGLMTYEDSVYNDKHQLKSTSAAVADGKVSYKDGAIVLTVHVKDNVYSFTTPSGLYLYVDGTHTMFVSEAGENTQFVLEQAEGGFYVKCANATYNDKPQYLEAYKGVFTTFGMNENNAAQYVFQFYSADPETPRTGDTSLSMLVALMAVSALGIVVVTSKKKEF